MEKFTQKSQKLRNGQLADGQPNVTSPALLNSTLHQQVAHCVLVILVDFCVIFSITQSCKKWDFCVI